MDDHGLPAYDASILTSSRALADYYDALVAAKADAKVAANWVMGEFAKHLNSSEFTVATAPVNPVALAGLIQLLDKGTISGKIAKDVFQFMWESGKDAETIVKEKGLVQISDTGAVDAIVEAVIAANPQPVADFKAGKQNALGFLVGQVMKQSKGRANPGMVNEMLKQKLQ